MVMIRTRKLLQKGLVFVIVIIVIPGLFATFINNLTGIFILSEWRGVVPEFGIPKCEIILLHPHAEKYLHFAIGLAPENRLTLINQGRIAWLKGDCASAKASWDLAQQIAPDDPIIAFWLFWANGVELFKISPIIGVDNLARYTDSTGWLTEQGGAFDAAISWYKLSFNLVPTQTLVERLSHLYIKTGYFDDAQIFWNHVLLILSPENSIYWWAKGQVAELNQEWALAAQAYGIGASLSETPFEYYNHQAEVSKQLGDWNQVEFAYRSAIRARPDVQWVYVEIGNVRYFLGDYNDAFSWYQQALTLSPKDPGVLYHLGETLYQQKHFSAAQIYFEKVLVFDPKYAKANYFLAQCLYLDNQTEKAIGFLTIAVDVSNENPWQWAKQLGDWKLSAGDKEGALVAYKKALEWNTMNEDIKSIINQIEENDR